MGSCIPFDAYDGSNQYLQQTELIDIWPIFKIIPPKISTKEKATSSLAFGGKNQEFC